MLTGRPAMTLTLTLSPVEALALRDALALSSRQPDCNVSLEPLWQRLGAYLDDRPQPESLPGRTH